MAMPTLPSSSLPMLDRAKFVEAQVNGRKLMRQREYIAAAAVYEAALSIQPTSVSSCVSSVSKELHSEVRGFAGELACGSTPYPCPDDGQSEACRNSTDRRQERNAPLQWLASEGSIESVVLSTRFLLGIALMRAGDSTGAIVQYQQLTANPAALIPGSGLHHKVFMCMAELCLSIGGMDRLKQGVAACLVLRSPLLLERHPWEMAELCDLEAALHIASCQCADGELCVCGSLDRAREAAEAAVSAGCKAAASVDFGRDRNQAQRKQQPQRKQQRKRELSLMQLQTKMGLVDAAAEEAAPPAAEHRRDRIERRRRQRDRNVDCLGNLLETLGPQIMARRHVMVDLCAGSSPPGSRLNWGMVPAVLQPWSEDIGGLVHDPIRLERKQWQLESLFVALSQVLQYHMPSIGIVQNTESPISTDQVLESGKVGAGGHYPRRGIHIVDFGSGSGNSVLAIAAVLPSYQFTLVEASQRDVSISRKRIADAGLQNVTVWHGDVANFPEVFDVGLATHLCGEGTDLAQAKCIEHRAAFVLTPCCLGKIKDVLKGQSRNRGVPENIRSEPGGGGGLLQYPRSDWLQQQMDTDIYLKIVRLSDYNGHDECGDGMLLSGVAAAGKQLLDADRLSMASEVGYETRIGKFWPEAASAKNDVLIGWPSDGTP